MKQRKNKVVGYLRVSTIDQTTEKNEADILRFANANNLGQVQFISEKTSGMKSWKNRKLHDVVLSLTNGDILIVPELSRIGRSIIDILDVLNELSSRGVKVYSVKENFQLNGTDIQSKVMRSMFALFAEIERDLISARTKEALTLARANGKQLGRPKGIGKSRLDDFQPEIIALLKNGSQKQFIAKRCGVSSAALHNWLKKHNLDNLKPMP